MNKDFNISSKNKKYLLETGKLLASGVKIKGWKKFKSSTRSMDAFYNEDVGIVLKNPRFILEPRTPLFLRAPTIKLGDGWVVQPFARKTQLKAAVEAIREQLRPYLAKGIFPDLHVGNVGWINNKAMLFDW